MSCCASSETLRTRGHANNGCPFGNIASDDRACSYNRACADVDPSGICAPGLTTDPAPMRASCPTVQPKLHKAKASNMTLTVATTPAPIKHPCESLAELRSIVAVG